MANGKPGDSEFLDIVSYGREAFGEKVDRLIRELHQLDGFDPEGARSASTCGRQ